MTNKHLYLRAVASLAIAVFGTAAITWGSPETDKALVLLLTFGFGLTFILMSKRLEKGAGRKA